MANAKHTQGPWTKADRLNGPWWHISASHTVGGERCRNGSQAIATVHGESKRGAEAYAEMFEANARLIASAPELLEALKATAHLLMACALVVEHAESRAHAIATARAANEIIAKATGETA